MPVMGGKYFYNGQVFDNYQDYLRAMSGASMTEPPVGAPEKVSITPAPIPTGKPQGLQINSGIKPQGMPQPDPSMAGFYGSSIQPPVGDTGAGNAGADAPEEKGFFGGLLDRLGGGAGLANRLGAAYFALHQDPNLQKFGMQGLQDIRAESAGNKTVKMMLESGMITPQQAGVLMQNPELIKTTYAALLKPKDVGTLQEGYEYAKSQGYKGSIEDYMKAKSSGTTIYTGDRMGGLNEDYLKKGNEALAKRHMAMLEQGDVASRNALQLRQIQGINVDTPDGMAAGIKAFAGQYGIELGEGVDNVQAMQAIINRLVPAQRPAGSGPMSDADLELFKRSLPQLMQQASGRQLVIDMIQEINAYDIKRGQIAEQMLYGDISQREGRALLKKLDEETTSLRERIQQGNPVEERDF